MLSKLSELKNSSTESIIRMFPNLIIEMVDPSQKLWDIAIHSNEQLIIHHRKRTREQLEYVINRWPAIIHKIPGFLGFKGVVWSDTPLDLLRLAIKKDPAIIKDLRNVPIEIQEYAISKSIETIYYCPDIIRNIVNQNAYPSSQIYELKRDIDHLIRDQDATLAHKGLLLFLKNPSDLLIRKVVYRFPRAILWVIPSHSLMSLAVERHMKDIPSRRTKIKLNEILSYICENVHVSLRTYPSFKTVFDHLDYDLTFDYV